MPAFGCYTKGGNPYVAAQKRGLNLNLGINLAWASILTTAALKQAILHEHAEVIHNLKAWPRGPSAIVMLNC